MIYYNSYFNFTIRLLIHANLATHTELTTFLRLRAYSTTTSYFIWVSRCDNQQVNYEDLDMTKRGTVVAPKRQESGRIGWRAVGLQATQISC